MGNVNDFSCTCYPSWAVYTDDHGGKEWPEWQDFVVCGGATVT